MRSIVHGRHAELAIDVAAAATMAAAVGFALGVGTADTDLACSAATIAFMLALASLRHVGAGETDRAISAGRPAPARPIAAARGEVVQFPGISRQPARTDLANRVGASRSAPPAADASQALSDALAELRRSLR
jgi:hypothetical protein